MAHDAYHRFTDPNVSKQEKLNYGAGLAGGIAGSGLATNVTSTSSVAEETSATSAGVNTVTPSSEAEANQAYANAYRETVKSPENYYEFPRFVRGEAPPALPKQFLTPAGTTSPYTEVMPRVWYWQDASEMRIQRTPELDKQLPWAIKENGTP
jgi:hypothetical protein